jgi:hypothetical protein
VEPVQRLRRGGLQIYRQLGGELNGVVHGIIPFHPAIYMRSLPTPSSA